MTVTERAISERAITDPGPLKEPKALACIGESEHFGMRDVLIAGLVILSISFVILIVFSIMICCQRAEISKLGAVKKQRRNGGEE